MSGKYRVLVVGLGNMGMSHALAYARIDGFEVAGLCERHIDRRQLPAVLAAAPKFTRFEDALAAVKPDVVSINTWSDTHADYAVKAMEAGAHVFVEKPLAETVADAERVIAAAKRLKKKVVIGYILRHHPSWTQFIETARTLGTPMVFRMNLNQQSSGKEWETHKRLLQTLSPIVDCGVHYVDVWCQIVKAKPVSVHAVGARLTEDMPPGMYNYGHFEVRFEDGSVGWYEAGWGPMMSETAFFVKDAIGPKGSVSIVVADAGGPAPKSADINTHTMTNQILVHPSRLAADGTLAEPDRRISMRDEPNHDQLCEREQRFLLKAIEEDMDLGEHMADAVKSLAIVLAADRSVRTGEVVRL
ncbi:MAG TPA: Gfo/Idh/MocA family oxidoreductase [Bauldia sp.]|nr:Gfo/Idh/MocA family oxidoreductase [Bauldia sp.]